MIEFKPDISKEELLLLPTCAFEGEIIVIDSYSNLNLFTEAVAHTQVLGFDTETKPNFRKGALNPVALLQLATLDTSFLIRINHIKLPKPVVDVLENPNILKIGVAIRDDIKALQKISAFQPNSFLDLQKYVKEFGIEANSIKKIAGIVLQSRVSKSQQLTDWEAPNLSDAQKKYAATDAWVCYQIYATLQNHH